MIFDRIQKRVHLVFYRVQFGSDYSKCLIQPHPLISFVVYCVIGHSPIHAVFFILIAQQ